MPDTVGGSQGSCRSCGHTDLKVFLSLGDLPLPDRLVDPDERDEPEPRFPLDVAFCPSCTLVQLLDAVDPELLFVDRYLYFSSYADDLLAHAAEHAAALVEERDLDADNLVVEVASNDGYLLRNFVDRGVEVLGIDPAPDQAAAAEEVGVPTLTEFFDADLATALRDERGGADVIIANNVMAHVPDVNGFMEGLSILVADDGIVTVENPYVRDLVDHCEFDTIYHEHVCYFSCHAVRALAARHGLHLNRVEEFPDLHGGSLRWTLGPRDEPGPSVQRHLEEERRRGLTRFAFYDGFGARVETLQEELRDLLHGLRARGAEIAAYGAAAKGSVLLNATGLGPDLIEYVVDRNPHKQGHLMPGVQVPIRGVEALMEDRPDHVLLLAWNFAREIMEQQQAYIEAGGRFVIPVPSPRIVP